MPISADQWRAVTGVNNVRRPRQVGIKPRYMQQETYGDNEKLSRHPEPDANHDIARGGTGSNTVPLGKNGSSRGRKDQSRPMREKVKDESRSTWVDGDHDNFTSTMTSSVMGVQILVSVVVMLLLLLSGDVETNPGPSLPFNPYDLMVKCSDKIIHGLSADPKTMATSLRAKGFIADGTLDDTFQLHETKNNKGRRLYTAVLGVVMNYPQRYKEFISLLEQNRSQYAALLEVLDTSEKEMKVKMSHDLKSSAHSVSKARPLRQPSQHSASSESVSDTDQRINDIATHHGLAPRQLDGPCDQSHLLPISQLLVHWLSYCGYLGLTAQEKNHIRTDLSLTAPHQKPEEMLKRWQQKYAVSNKSHYRYLLRGCIEINDNAQLVGEICKVIAKNPIGGIGTSISPGSTSPKPSSSHSADQSQQSEGTDTSISPGSTNPKPCSGPSPDQSQQSAISTSGVQSTPADHQDNQSIGVPTHELPYCAIPLSPPEVEGQPSQKREMQQQQNAASGQMSRDKMWSSSQDVLYVYFMNPLFLSGVSLNTQNIIDWAKIWEHPSYPQIPKFRETKDETKAVIRVKFTASGRSLTKVGIESLTTPTGPTMCLNLQKGNNDYKTHIVIHEFGHALGLEHEHQRSCFWSIASKFLDVGRMKADPLLSGTNIDDYLERQTQGVEYETEYDPDSVMHYWFKLEWMKDPKHRTQFGIEADKSLGENDKKVLKGICTRQLKLAEKPSNIDYTFLAKHYGASATNNGASQSPSVLNGGSGLPAKNSAAGPVPRESGNSEASDVEEVDGPRRKPQHGKDAQTLPTGTHFEHVIEQISVVAMEMNNDTAVEGLQAIAVSLTSSKLKMGVIGITNSGKSTLLNALLQKNILPTHFDPQTASLVCIKHDSESCGELFERKLSENKLTCIASGVKEVREKLCNLDNKQRLGNDQVPESVVLELHAPVNFLSGTNDIDLEIYDTPGTSEAGNPHVRQLAEQARKDLAGMILVLAAGSACLNPSANLLKDLKTKYPLLLSQDENRILVLVNKYDVMFEDDDNKPSLDDEQQKLAEKTKIAPDKIVFCSAKLGLEAVKFLRDPESVTPKDFRKARGNDLVLQLPESEQCEKFCEENVKKLGEMLKSASKIEDVEKQLKSSCTNFREILKRKAVDECQSLVTELKEIAEKHMKRIGILRVQLFKKFPEEVKADFTVQLGNHVSTLIKEVSSGIQLSQMLRRTHDSRHSVSQLIDTTRSSLLAEAKPKLCEAFMGALNDLRARLSILSGRKIDQLSTEIEKVENDKDCNIDIDVGMLVEIPQLTIEPEIEGHVSIETATLHSHITSCSETRKIHVYASKTVDEDHGAGKTRVHSLVDAGCTVTVYKASIDGLNDSFREFARYCGDFLREKIEAALEEQTHKIACKAVAEVLKSSGEGHTKKIDEQIELWKNRKAKLDDAEQRLKEI